MVGASDRTLDLRRGRRRRSGRVGTDGRVAAAGADVRRPRRLLRAHFDPAGAARSRALGSALGLDPRVDHGVLSGSTTPARATGRRALLVGIRARARDRGVGRVPGVSDAWHGTVGAHGGRGPGPAHADAARGADGAAARRRRDGSARFPGALCGRRRGGRDRGLRRGDRIPLPHIRSAQYVCLDMRSAGRTPTSRSASSTGSAIRPEIVARDRTTAGDPVASEPVTLAPGGTARAVSCGGRPRAALPSSTVLLAPWPGAERIAVSEVLDVVDGAEMARTVVRR